MKNKVMIMAGYYIPSVKGGGPIQSIKNLVNNLSDNLDFYIVAADRDLGDDKPFVSNKVDEWVNVGKAKVYYTNTSKLTYDKCAEIINSVDYDVIYLNSFFSYKFSILPIILSKMNRIQKKTIVVAPRGQFSPGALNFKSSRKRVFIGFAKIFGLYKNIIWHATAEMEKKDIEEVFGINSNIKVASNLTTDYRKLEYDKELVKNKEELKIVFISRVHPKKNLKKAIEFLKKVNGKVEFNIYGPIEDDGYWIECKKVINDLPDNIHVKYNGLIIHDKVIEIFKNNHVFLFPTLGENYGHVISEALIGGCPVIISDQTPWSGLEKSQIGWDIKLTDETKFIEAIQYCVNLNDINYKAISKKAFEYGKKKSNSEIDIENTRKLFE